MSVEGWARAYSDSHSFGVGGGESVAAGAAGAIVLHGGGGDRGPGRAGVRRGGALLRTVPSRAGAQPDIRGDLGRGADGVLGRAVVAAGDRVPRVLRFVSPAFADGLLRVGAGVGDQLLVAVAARA